MESAYAEPRPGDLIAGKYRVDRLIGRGGMGEVLAARHVELREDVAIKVVRADQAGDAVQVARFLREARTAAKIKSEHVARVFDYGRLDDGRPFLVMELLRGKSLSHFTGDGPRPAPAQVVRWVLEACEAVGEAHALGVVHRDLKPDNMFLAVQPDGSEIVKVLDFGISKVDSAEERSMTHTRDTMGSPSYMSPEQLRSAKEVDAGADIWSLGVILYELLSGSLPFEGETIGKLCTKVLMDEPRSLALLVRLPDGLEDVVLHCLRKDRTKRVASVEELALALAPFADADVSQTLARLGRFARITKPPPPKSDAPGPSMSNAATVKLSEKPGAATGAAWISASGRPPRRSVIVPLVALAVALVAVLGIGLGVNAIRQSSSDGASSTSREEAAAPAVAVVTPSASSVPPEPAARPEPAASAEPIASAALAAPAIPVALTASASPVVASPVFHPAGAAPSKRKVVSDSTPAAPVIVLAPEARENQGDARSAPAAPTTFVGRK